MRIRKALREEASRRQASGKYRLGGLELETAVSIAEWGGDQRGKWAVDPPADRLVPVDGAWIAIAMELPPIEGGLNERLTVGRVFYALHLPEADEEGFMTSGQYRVLVPTPWGEAQLWPHEYLVLPTAKVIECWQEEWLTFHPTSIDAARMNDVVFYAQSRGLSLADASVMALGSLRAPVGWFEPHEEFAATIELVGRMGAGLTAENHRRRAAARARRVAL